jgi:ABC-type glycerol-3-phosphate transport system substrate-binding protein
MTVTFAVSACSSAATTPPVTGTPPASQALASQAPASATPTAAPTPLPSITAWMFPGPEGDAMKAATAEYTKITGNPVDLQVLGRDVYTQKRSLYLTGGGAGACLIEGDDFNTASFAAAGALAPWDDYGSGVQAGRHAPGCEGRFEVRRQDVHAAHGLLDRAALLSNRFDPDSPEDMG